MGKIVCCVIAAWAIRVRDLTHAETASQRALPPYVLSS